MERVLGTRAFSLAKINLERQLSCTFGGTFSVVVDQADLKFLFLRLCKVSEDTHASDAV
jgi:hypothetical protein